MTGEAKPGSKDNLVVFAGDGDWNEKQEMVAILRDLASALEHDLNVGNPLLVLEKHCLERLQAEHRKAHQAGA